MSVYGAEHRMRVDSILRDVRIAIKKRPLAVWNYILTSELQNGTQFICAQPDGQLYMVLGHDNSIVRIPTRHGTGSGWTAYLDSTYGLSEDGPLARSIHAQAKAYATSDGEKAEMRRFAAFKRETNTGYISSYDGRMWKVDGAEISRVPNGEDGIFFADDDKGRTCDPDIGPHGQLLECLTSLNFSPLGLSGITPELQRKALTVWLFAVAFPDLFQHKPILLVVGEKGSGKTSQGELLQLVLTGDKKAMILEGDRPSDFGSMLLRSPIALFDNTDSWIDWLPDAIAGYTTGASWTRRKLYTDSESHEIKPHAFIVIATRNPASFRRDDVADRCVILRLERWIDFESATELRDRVINNRSALFGEYLYYLGQIITNIREQGRMAIANERFRMSDFAALGRIVGKVLGWADQDVTNMLKALQGESEAMANEGDPLLELLRKWIVYRPRGGPQNIGRTLTEFELHAELGAFAAAGQIEWKYTPRTLAQKLRSINSEFNIATSVMGGTRYYQIRRNTDAVLELVDDISDVETPIPEVE